MPPLADCHRLPFAYDFDFFQLFIEAATPPDLDWASIAASCAAISLLPQDTPRCQRLLPAPLPCCQRHYTPLPVPLLMRYAAFSILFSPPHFAAPGFFAPLSIARPLIALPALRAAPASRHFAAAASADADLLFTYFGTISLRRFISDD